MGAMCGVLVTFKLITITYHVVDNENWCIEGFITISADGLIQIHLKNPPLELADSFSI